MKNKNQGAGKGGQPEDEQPGEAYSYTVKIPLDRVAVLIGVKGRDKKELEDYSQASIDVDSKEGDVTITGKDPVKLYSLKEVVRAIARGFNPDKARLLLKPDYMLEIISLKDYGLAKPGHARRVKARIIGTRGKARRALEDLTGTSISVYGKTISILGYCDDVANAKKAVEMLVQGSMHATVYKWLEDQKRKTRMAQDDLKSDD